MVALQNLILSLNKVRITLQSIINSATGKYCSVAFILNGHTLGISSTQKG